MHLQILQLLLILTILLFTAVLSQSLEDSLNLSILPSPILQESGIRFKLFFKATDLQSELTIKFQLQATDLIEPLYDAVSATTTFYFNDDLPTPYEHTHGENVAPPFSLSFTPVIGSPGSFETLPTQIPFTTPFDPLTMNINFFAVGFISLSDIQSDLLLEHEAPFLTVTIEPLIPDPDSDLFPNPAPSLTYTDRKQIIYFQDIFASAIASGISTPPLIVDFLPPSQHPLDFRIPDQDLFWAKEEPETNQTYFSLLLPNIPIRLRAIDIHFNGAVRFGENQYDIKTLPICALNNDLNTLSVFLAYDSARYPVLHIELRQDHAFWYEQDTTSRIVCTGGFFQPLLVRRTDQQSTHVGCTIAVEFHLLYPPNKLYLGSNTSQNSQNSQNDELQLGYNNVSFETFNPNTYVHHYQESAIKTVYIPGYEPYYPTSSLGQYSYSSELDLRDSIGFNYPQSPIQQSFQPTSLNVNEFLKGHDISARETFRTVIYSTFLKNVQYPFPPELTPPTLYFQVELQWPLLATSEYISIYANYFIFTVSPQDETETLKYYGSIDEAQRDIAPTAPGFWKSNYLKLDNEEKMDFSARKIQFIFTIQHHWMLRKNNIQGHPTIICSMYYQVQKPPQGYIPPLGLFNINNINDNENVINTNTSITSITNIITNNTTKNNNITSQYLQATSFSTLPPQTLHTDSLNFNTVAQPNAIHYINDTIVLSGAHSFTFDARISSTDIGLEQFKMDTNFKQSPQDHMTNDPLDTSNDITTDQSVSQLSASALRNFSLSLTFRTKSTAAPMSSFFLSLHTEPGYSFYGIPKDDCTLNGEVTVAEFISPFNHLTNIIFFPNSSLEPDQKYNLKCGGDTLSVQFDPTYARLDRSIQIHLLAFGTTPLFDELLPQTNKTQSIHHQILRMIQYDGNRKKEEDMPEDTPDDRSDFSIIPQYSRSINVLPAQIMTDEKRLHHFYVVLAIILSSIGAFIILLILAVFIFKCCQYRKKRQEEYDKLMFDTEATFDDVGDEWLGSPADETYSDFTSLGNSRGITQPTTPTTFGNFGQNRNIVKSPLKKQQRNHLIIPDIHNASTDNSYNNIQDGDYTDNVPIVVGSNLKLSVNNSPMREPFIGTSYAQPDPYDLSSPQNTNMYHSDGGYQF